MNRILIVTTVAVAIVFSGCGDTSSGASQMLAMIGNDTLSVSDLAKAWSELETEQREVFMSGSSPSRDFVETFLRKELLLRELDVLGYMDDTSLSAFGESWFRIENAILTARLLQAENEAGVTPEDLAGYRANPWRDVWFTVRPGSPEEVSYTDVDMRALPLDLYRHLDSLSPGNSGTNISGTVVRLDSIAPPRPIQDADAAENADSIDTWRIANQRVRLFMIEAQTSAKREYSVSIDSAALERFALNTVSIDNIKSESIIIRSGFRNWTAAELRYEVDFLNTMMPTQSNSFDWLCFLIDGIILHSRLLEYAEEHYPGSLDSLRIERDAWLENLALDRMYKALISDRVEVGEADIEEQYALLEEPFILEERRVLETAVIPSAALAEYERRAIEGDIEEMIAGLQPLQRLSDDNSNPRISRPLRLVEVPAELGSVVFQLTLSDTISWKGPYPIDEVDGYILFRLAGIVPAREAGMDEIIFDLEVMARRRIEERATEDWLLELEEQYDVVVNEEVLNSLPKDPGEW